MASGSKDEKGGAPALDDVRTEKDAEAAIGGKDAAGARGADATVPPPSGDSPKPHGDRMANAVREAAEGTPDRKGSAGRGGER